MVEEQSKQPEQVELSLETESPREPETVEEEGEAFEWTCHPVRRRPLVSLAVTVFVFLVGVIVYMATASNVFTVLALLVLYASLAKFYFPTHYRFTGKGIEIRTTTQKLFKPWSMFRSLYPDKNGVLLSPFTRPTRLENFRGLYVLFAGNREAVTEYARRHVGVKSSGSEAADSRTETPAPGGGEKPA